MSSVSTICVRCGSNERLVELDCNAGHSMCKGCLKVNVQKYGSEDMYTCPECSTDTASFSTKQKPIWIFVDDSNIWIQAKKLVSKLKRFKTKEDSRLRIDVGKLADVVAKGRPVEKGILYGSEPPKIDSVWKKIREKGWEVKTKERSTLTHKEKEVDGQLITDVTAIACKTPERDRSTIVLITGDADVKPAVRKIVEEGVWHVEIYMWRQGFSSRLKQLPQESNVVRCFDLDDHLENVTFTSWAFKGKQIPPNSSVVLRMEPNAFPTRIPSKEWWRKLESVAQWPMQGAWVLDRSGKETNDYVLVFTSDTKTYDVTSFVDDLTRADCIPLPFVIHAETYHGYKRRRKDFDAYINLVEYGNLEISKQDDEEEDDTHSESSFVMDEGKVVPYKPMQVHFPPLLSGQLQTVDHDVPDQSANNSKTGYQTVPPRPVPVRSKDCRYEKNCRQGKDCPYKHSPHDMKYFERRGGKGNPLRKVSMCENFSKGRCSRGATECDFAHGERDAWCLACRTTGHFTTNCPKETK